MRLTVPVDWLVNVPIFSGIYFVGGADFGAAFDHWARQRAAIARYSLDVLHRTEP